MSKPQRQSSSQKAKAIKTSSDNNSVEHVSLLINTEQLQTPKRQPRRSFNPEKMEQLTESIKRYGILEPLIVRPLNDDKYELVAGERRYRGAQKAGLTQIPVIVKDLDEDEAFELALLENMQRDDLNAIDETEGMLELLCQSLNISREEVIQLLNRAANAQKRGQSLTDNVTRQIEIIDRIFLTVGRLNRESFRTNRLPLLNLPEDVLEVLRQGKLDYTKGKAIAKVEDISQRRELMELSIKERLPLRTIKQRIIEIQSSLPRRKVTIKDDFDDFRDLYAEFKAITQIKSDAWNDESKKPQIENLLNQLKQVLGII